MAKRRGITPSRDDFREAESERLLYIRLQYRLPMLSRRYGSPVVLAKCRLKERRWLKRPIRPIRFSGAFPLDPKLCLYCGGNWKNKDCPVVKWHSDNIPF